RFFVHLPYETTTTLAHLSSCDNNKKYPLISLTVSNLCIAAAHCPIREILEKEKG
ncbi:hypothetical protein RYX36_014692, partial [Vicia faba]